MGHADGNDTVWCFDAVLPLLEMISWRVGRSIPWDGAKEEITGDAEAGKLLSRPYRAPWVYPA